LLLIGTYRPVDVIVREHPMRTIKQELQMHGRCEELALGFLSEAAVGEYLAVRFSVNATSRLPLQHLARMIHKRTDGNPLFIVNVVDHLSTHGALTQAAGQWAVQEAAEEIVADVARTLR